jgi:hypothetical protein
MAPFMPFGPSVSTSRAPRILSSLRRSRLNVSDQLQPLRRGDERKCDAGVSARRFDQDGVLVDPARFQRVVDHRETDAILDAGERVEEFQLEHDVREGAVRRRGAVEAHERSVADGCGDVWVDSGHGGRGVRV